MTKKSVLLATLLAGMTLTSGCDEQPSPRPLPRLPKKNQVKLLDTPIFVNELPRAMLLPSENGGTVQLLYPIQKGGTVLEDKEQYEKRIKWLNEHYPEKTSQAPSLHGYSWKKRTKPPETPFVSIFDKKEYIYYHISWMQDFYKPGNQWGVDYSPQKDPMVLWWVTQVEVNNLFKDGKDTPLKQSRQTTR